MVMETVENVASCIILSCDSSVNTIVEAAIKIQDLETGSQFDNSQLETGSQFDNSQFENMKASIKTEVPSGTTIHFSSISLDSDLVYHQDILQTLGFSIGDTIHKKSYNRTALQAQDHVLAERKRRERLTQRFIALSCLIPNLNKLDKASVLGGAIKYIKQLEERVKTIEGKEQKRNEKPVVAVKRARIRSSSEEYSSCSEEISSDGSLPDIEVKASDGNVMIRICCNKQNGIIKEIFGEVENLHLSIVSSSSMPFGYNTIHITIIAQMDHKLSMTPDYVANRIRAALMKE